MRQCYYYFIIKMYQIKDFYHYQYLHCIDNNINTDIK